jgi:cysteine desulfurase/selenocysteine lyase
MTDDQGAELAAGDFELARIREDFEFFAHQAKSERPIVYFDNAATALKPRTVVAAVNRYDTMLSANVHRGIHALSEESTHLFEQTRVIAQEFLNAAHASEIIYTSGTTHGINSIALGWARFNLREGDEIILSEMEHHANIVPWHLLARDRGVVLKFIPLHPSMDGTLDEDALPRLITPRTRLVSLVMISNALGTINPIEKILNTIRAVNPNIHTVLDAAQAASHADIDVQKLGCSALCFSGHKVFGPTGTGIMYLRSDFRDAFQPFFGGGDMINTVELAGSTFADFPARLEPGTPNISGFIGLGAALSYVRTIGKAAIQRRESALREYMESKLRLVDGLRIIGTGNQKIPVFSFALRDYHPHDIATILDRYGIAVRSGHHCAQPLMRALGMQATTRASLSFYNSKEEIDAFVAALERTKELLS